MARSQNGWPAFTSGTDPNLVAIPEVAGRVRKGDVATIFVDFNAWFAREIEPIAEAAGQPQDDWGFANRPVTGGRALSNHASGTAEDLNAPKHPYRKVGTFTAAQTKKIRARMAYYSHVLRWGGDYVGTKDEMHFEINANEAEVAKVAARIRAGGSPAPVVPSTRFVDVARDYGFYNEIEWAATAGITTGYPDRTFRPGALVSRAELAVMLFRFAGAAQLKDVPADHPFALAIGWMQGSSPAIARGFGDGTFAPDATVARVDAALFLWRHSGTPAVDLTTGAFSDIGDLGVDAQSACAWLLQSGISRGFAVEGQSPAFRPDALLTRADWVVFLYRLAKWSKR